MVFQVEREKVETNKMILFDFDVPGAVFVEVVVTGIEWRLEDAAWL